MTAHFAMLRIENVVESKSNPRKHFDDLDDLVVSVKEKGVLSPVKARPVNGHFELVYGARRLRAAKAVGLTEIPALVQEMNDKEVLEEQIVENAQRTDVPPLEEAEGYRALIEKHGYTPDDIAAKVGKSKRVVYERDGKIHELVPRAVADKARAQAEPPAPRGTADPQAKKQAEEAKRRWAIVRATSVAVLDKAQRKGPDATFWRVLIGGLTIGSWHDALREVVKARGWKEEKASPEEMVREGMLKLKEDELPVLALQIVIAKGGASYWGDVLGVALKQAAKSYGVDVDKIKDQVKAEKKAAKTKPAKAGKACAIPGCGESGKRVKGSPGLWCKDHGTKLSAAERKSIDDRNKRLAAEGKKGGKK